MASYSIADTKDNLSALINKAMAGEEVLITRRGKATARIVADLPIVSSKDAGDATDQLRAWHVRQKIVETGIRYERFRDWLDEDENG